MIVVVLSINNCELNPSSQELMTHKFRFCIVGVEGLLNCLVCSGELGSQWGIRLLERDSCIDPMEITSFGCIFTLRELKKTLKMTALPAPSNGRKQRKRMHRTQSLVHSL
jgi:hypothetical protein